MYRIILMGMMVLWVVGSSGCDSTTKRLDQPADTQPSQVRLEDVTPIGGGGVESGRSGSMTDVP